jgi:site-specific recombinase XerD
MANGLRVERSGQGWKIGGEQSCAGLGLFNDYLAYLGDRRYSPASVRAYAFDLLHFARWLADEHIGLDAVRTDTLLSYLAACRTVRACLASTTM